VTDTPDHHPFLGRDPSPPKPRHGPFFYPFSDPALSERPPLGYHPPKATETEIVLPAINRGERAVGTFISVPTYCMGKPELKY